MAVRARDLARAVRLLRAGQLVVFPTETVYGLGADAGNARAVRRIYALKGRPSTHPVIVHLADADQLEDWVKTVPPAARALAAAFWPGPLTLVLKKGGRVPDAVTGGGHSVALRVPAHPVALALLKTFAGGIAAPSANRFGRVSPTTAEHVREEFGERAPFILDGGPCPVGVESTIVALTGRRPLLLRPGRITRAELAEVIGDIRIARPGQGPRASGRLRSHYAPGTPLLIERSARIARASARAGTAVLARRRAPAGYSGPLWIAAPSDPARYARSLYANLRLLDRSGAARILVEAVPRSDPWTAVADRLARAAAGQAPEEGS
jgi:L-threonylcarbamoyladenylate synthase